MRNILGQFCDRPTEERFWEKVSKSKECWIWIAGKSRDGYGVFRDHKKRNTGRAHRFSWRLHFGDIPNRSFVLHKCDVRLCVRPDHLFLGNAKDNFHDAVRKRRIVSREIAAKLSISEVRAIRSLHLLGQSYNSLAKKFHIDRSNIYQIVKNHTWRLPEIAVTEGK